MTDPLLEVKDLVKRFPVRGGLFNRARQHVHAVDGVDLAIRPGRTLGLVGESGCGKTTVGRTVLRLLEPTSGSIRFGGDDISRVRGRALRRVRRHMQIVFQDPMSSLNPRMTVRRILTEPLQLAGVPRATRGPRVDELLSTVGLASRHADRYPHEFSGGQRQRVGIARALALRPSFIVLDEPTSALDVSVQAQILNLLQRLQDEMGLTYLFISHDLSVVRRMCDDVAVMYLGRIVEEAPAERLFDDASHPYTHALLSAVPIPDPTRRARRIVLSGDVPSPIDPPAGCRFYPRCIRARDVCRAADPALAPQGAGARAACHFAGPLRPEEAGARPARPA